jgi:hypothetical protein
LLKNQGKCDFFIFLLFFFFIFPTAALTEETSLLIDQQALATIYSGKEKMHFSISWSGGIKIGDLYMTVVQAESGDGLAIIARVTDYGLFKLFYPVDDTFTTFIRGPLKLPYRYEVHQKEGRGMDVRRLTLYDQQKLAVLYRKNNNPQTSYSMNGTAYNEFSSFFITRALQLDPVRQEIVPTFVDKKRHKVAVKVFGVEPRKTIFGTINTIKVMPKMSFKGLYDKDGDTVFWLSNDSCRVPVEIESKILIGSLVAELVEYTNPACHLKGVLNENTIFQGSLKKTE